jgi:hypothetical protein
MTEARLYEAFDDCLMRLLAGEALDDCLELYPELADELRPMLEVAQRVQQLSRVPKVAELHSRKRLLTAAAQLRATRAPKGNRWIMTLRRALPALAALLIFILISSTGLYYASANTLPGDGLYPLKRTVEGVRLQWAANPSQRFMLEQEFAERRRAELGPVLADSRVADVDFEGTLVKVDGRQWQVDEFTLQVDSQTRIVGGPLPGQRVKVKAQSRAGMLTALEIAVQEVDLTGPLTPAGERWAIDEIVFVLLPEAVIKGRLEAGALATARIRELHNGERVAVSITVFPLATLTATHSATVRPSPTVEATATATPSFTATPSPEPTAVIQSSATSEPEKTPEPTPEVSTPQPTAIPEPSAPPQPTEIRQPSEAPQPSATKKPSKTPEPEDTEKPSKTPEPEDTEKPSKTPQPSDTRKPSHTPQP